MAFIAIVISNSASGIVLRQFDIFDVHVIWTYKLYFDLLTIDKYKYNIIGKFIIFSLS